MSQRHQREIRSLDNRPRNAFSHERGEEELTHTFPCLRPALPTCKAGDGEKAGNVHWPEHNSINALRRARSVRLRKQPEEREAAHRLPQHCAC